MLKRFNITVNNTDGQKVREFERYSGYIIPADGGAVNSSHLNLFDVNGDTIVGSGTLNVSRKELLATVAKHQSSTSYAIRTRFPISAVHTVQSVNDITTSLASVTLSSPIVLRTLANDESRDVIVERLSDVQFIRGVSLFVTGAAQRVRVGKSRRYSLADLFKYVSSVCSDLNNSERTVIARVVYEALLPLDIHYNSLELFEASELQTRLMSIDDISVLAKEMEIASAIGDSRLWIDKRVLGSVSEGDEIWRTVIEESLSSSLLAFKSRLGRTALFKIKFDAVLLCARMALVSALGVKTNYRDFIIAELAISDVNIQAMSRWACIAEDLLAGGSFDEKSLANEYARGMSAEVITRAAEQIVSAVENHPLVRRYSINEFSEKLSVSHVHVQNGGFHWMTQIAGALPSNFESAVFNEYDVGRSIFRPEYNTIGSGVVNELTRGIQRFLNNARVNLLDLCVAENMPAISLIDEKGNLLENVDGIVSLYNVNVRELLLKCISVFDVTMWYQESGTGDGAYAHIINWCFNVPMNSNSVLTALNVTDNTLLIDDVFAASFFLPNQDGVSSFKFPNSANTSLKSYFSKDYLHSVLDIGNSSQLIMRNKGVISIPSKGQSANGRFNIHLSRLMHVADSVRNYVMANEDVRYSRGIMACVLAEYNRAIRESVTAVDPRLSHEISRGVALGVMDIITGFSESNFFNSLRRVILDDVARSMVDGNNLGSWANFIHDVDLRSDATLAAATIAGAICGLDAEHLGRFFADVRADRMANAMLYMHIKDSHYVTVDASKL